MKKQQIKEWWRRNWRKFQNTFIDAACVAAIAAIAAGLVAYSYYI